MLWASWARCLQSIQITAVQARALCLSKLHPLLRALPHQWGTMVMLVHAVAVGMLLQTVPRSPSPLKKDSRIVDALAAFQDSPQVYSHTRGVCWPSRKCLQCPFLLGSSMSEQCAGIWDTALMTLVHLSNIFRQSHDCQVTGLASIVNWCFTQMIARGQGVPWLQAKPGFRAASPALSSAKSGLLASPAGKSDIVPLTMSPKLATRFALKGAPLHSTPRSSPGVPSSRRKNRLSASM